MAPPKGFPKPEGSGRKPGQRNRFKAEVERALEGLGADPMDALDKIGAAAAASGKLHLAAYCYGKLLPFKYPALSRMTVTPGATDEAAALMAAIAAARGRPHSFVMPAPLELPRAGEPGSGPMIDVTPTAAAASPQEADGARMATGQAAGRNASVGTRGESSGPWGPEFSGSPAAAPMPQPGIFRGSPPDGPLAHNGAGGFARVGPPPRESKPDPSDPWWS